jgi:hypothetical protein
MGTRTDADDTTADPGNLRELPDPDFIIVWSDLRLRLALTPVSSSAHPEIKSQYDAAKAEFLRRLSRWP